MNISRNKRIAIGILAALLVVAGVCIYSYIGAGSKEKITAKNYITMLQKKGFISDNVNFKKCKSLNKTDPSKAEKYYSVTVDNYAIDMDAQYNILGFNNQSSKAEQEKLTLDKAKEIAENYVKGIYDGECIFKETVKEEEAQKVPYYTFIFAKSKEGIPFYSYSLSIKVNKETGKLDGFSNSSIDVQPKDNVVSISSQTAETTVKNTFSKLNTFINFDENTYKAYCEDKGKEELELCYVVTIKGLESNGKDIRMKYFVSTETGEIINSEKSNVAKLTT